MIPVGVAVVFLAYTTGIWGYCLVRGYNVPFTALFKSTWPGSGSAPGIASPQAIAGLGQATSGALGITTTPPTPNAQPTPAQQITGQG